MKVPGKNLALLTGSAFSDRFFDYIERNLFGFTLIAMFAGLIARMLFLGEFSIYLDEAVSIFTAQQKLSNFIVSAAEDNNPPLYYFLLHIWVRLFGTGEEAVRMLSTLFSVATIPLLIALARRYFNIRAAVYATCFFIFSDISIFYSKEARAYSLVVFLVVLSIWYLLRLRESGRWRYALLLSVVNLLLMLSHYGIYVFFPMQALFALLFFPFLSRRFFRYVAGQMLTVLLFLPWYFYWQAHIEKSLTWVKVPDWKSVHYVLLRFAGNAFWLKFFAVLFLGIFPVALISRLIRTRNDLPFVSLCLLWGFGAFSLSILLSILWQPSFRHNYVLFTLPGMLLLGAWAWSAFPLNRDIKLLLFGIMIVLMAWQTEYNYVRMRSWREAAHVVRQVEEPGSVKLITKHFFLKPFLYYYEPQAFRDYYKMLAAANAKRVFIPGQMRGFYEKNPVCGESLLLVGLEKRLKDPENPTRRSLEMRYELADQYREKDLLVLRYECKGLANR